MAASVQAAALVNFFLLKTGWRKGTAPPYISHEVYEDGRSFLKKMAESSDVYRGVVFDDKTVALLKHHKVYAWFDAENGREVHRCVHGRVAYHVAMTRRFQCPYHPHFLGFPTMWDPNTKTESKRQSKASPSMSRKCFLC